MSKPLCNCEIIICTPDLFFPLDDEEAVTVSFEINEEELKTEIPFNVATKPQNSGLIKQKIKPTITKTITKKPKRVLRNKNNCEVCNNTQNIGKYCSSSIPCSTSLCKNCLITRAILTLKTDFETATAAIALIDLSEEPFILPSLNYNINYMLEPSSTPISGSSELCLRSNNNLVADVETTNRYTVNMLEPSPGPSTSRQNLNEEEEDFAPKDYTFKTLNKQQKLNEIANALNNVNSTNKPGSAVNRTNFFRRNPNKSHAESEINTFNNLKEHNSAINSSEHYFINLNHISGGYLIDNSTKQFIQPETNSGIFKSAPVTNVGPFKTVPLSLVPNGPFKPVPVTIVADGPHNPESVLILANGKPKRIPVKIAPARPGMPYTSRPVTTIANETHRRAPLRIAPARPVVPFTYRPGTVVVNGTHTNVPAEIARPRPVVPFTYKPETTVGNGTQTRVPSRIAPARPVVPYISRPITIADGTQDVPVSIKPAMQYNYKPITIIPNWPYLTANIMQHNQELSYYSDHSTEYLANLKPKMEKMPLNANVSQNTVENFQPRQFLREPDSQGSSASQDVFNAASVVYSLSQVKKNE